MKANLFLLLISFILRIFVLGDVKGLRPRDSFTVKPDEEVYSNEGSDVTLEWHFHVGSWSGSSTTVSEFLFGVWDDSGFVRNKILSVQRRNAVSKRRGFERKVEWSGNIYDCVNCTARVKMYNLTFADFKKYGVEVELSLDRRHLTNWVRLVKFGQTTDSDITGFITEPLDLICINPQRDKDINVARYLSQNLEEPDTLERFVISKWDETIRNYTKICNTQHKLYNLCSQVTSYVTANVTHFVIESAPLELNKYKTQCAYEYDGHTLKNNSRGSVQIIALRGKIEGCVGGRIQKECYHPSSYRCRSVTLKINNTETKTSDTNMRFPCLHGRCYNVCRDHMNSSYVNGTCRVIFVFNKTPILLNNSRLRCHIRYQNVSTDNYYSPIDTIIFLRYKRKGTTSTTASSTTTSTNGTNGGLTGGAIAGIVIGCACVAVAIVIVVGMCWWKRKCCFRPNHTQI